MRKASANPTNSKVAAMSRSIIRSFVAADGSSRLARWRARYRSAARRVSRMATQVSTSTSTASATRPKTSEYEVSVSIGPL